MFLLKKLKMTILKYVNIMERNKMLLKEENKELFVSTIKKIQSGLDNRDNFSKDIQKYCGSYVVLDVAEDWLNGLIELLSYMVNDTDDTISWWLFEDVEKTIYIDANSKYNSTNYDIEFDVSTPERLFDYFIFLQENKSG